MQFQTPQTRATLQAISDGPAGIQQTLKHMRTAVRNAVRDPNQIVRNEAIAITRGIRSKDFPAEVRAIYDWVTDNIRFVKDPRGVETVATPQKTLELGAGDCDDQAVLICSLLESVGHPCRFHAVGFMPGILSHVFAETKIGPRWVPLETTVSWID